jgi:RNA polymerase sigma factor (sigma-70 family)
MKTLPQLPLAAADVLRTLDELGPRTRDIFVLFRLERMKQKDIAALLGIGQGTVEKHVMKAVLHLAARNGSRVS